MTNFSKAMGFSTAAGTGQVDYMQKLGFLTCNRPVDDKRKMCVYTTNKTLLLIEEINNQIQKTTEESFSPEDD